MFFYKSWFIAHYYFNRLHVMLKTIRTGFTVNWELREQCHPILTNLTTKKGPRYYHPNTHPLSSNDKKTNTHQKILPLPHPEFAALETWTECPSVNLALGTFVDYNEQKKVCWFSQSILMNKKNLAQQLFWGS